MNQSSHHPIFDQFNRTPARMENGVYVDFLGISTTSECSMTVISPPQETLDLSSMHQQAAGKRVTVYEQGTDLPHRSTEEYLEYVDILTAVDKAEGKFTFVDLGAGLGFWSIVAHHACLRRKRMPQIQSQILSVEPSPFRCGVIENNFKLNGIDSSNAYIANCGLTQLDEGQFYMPVGETHDGLAACILQSPDMDKFFRDYPSAKAFNSEFSGKVQPFVPIKTRKLASLLEPVNKVDLIDWDIQALEFEVILANRELLKKKVKNMHISTHRQHIDHYLMQVLIADGWKINYFYPLNQISETPYGTFMFGDGRISVSRDN
jgi:FkbM family methyltransferase